MVMPSALNRRCTSGVPPMKRSKRSIHCSSSLTTFCNKRHEPVDTTGHPDLH